MEDKQTCRMIDAYLSIFGSRWNLLIMNELFKSPKRFNELKRALSPITQTVLVRHLKTLEEMGMIERNVVADGSSNTYPVSKRAKNDHSEDPFSSPGSSVTVSSADSDGSSFFGSSVFSPLTPFLSL